MITVEHPVSISSMWRDIKKLTGNGSFRPINEIKIDNSSTSDPLLISDVLADHFSSVSSNSNATTPF